MWEYICTYLKISFANFIFSQFSSNPTYEHIIAVSRVYQDLQTTKKLKIVYCRGFI